MKYYYNRLDDMKSFHHYFQGMFFISLSVSFHLWSTHFSKSVINCYLPDFFNEEYKSANNETFWYFTFGHDYSEWKHGGLCAHEKMLDGIRNVVSCHDTLPYLPNPKQKGKKPTTKTTEKNPSSAQQNLKVPTETMKSTDVGVKLPWGKIQQSNDDGTIVS